MMITMAINTRREDNLRELEQQLEHHAIALEKRQELADIRAELEEERATISSQERDAALPRKLSLGGVVERERSRV